MGICKENWHTTRKYSTHNYQVTAPCHVRSDVFRAGLMGCNQCGPTEAHCSEGPYAWGIML